MAEILRVRRPFSIGRKTYRRGQLVRSNEAVAKSHGHLMVSVTDEAEERVERATAAPGERRDIFARQKAAVAKAKEKEAKKAAKADDAEPASPSMSNTKAELLEAAAAAAVEADKSMTKAQILEALED